MGILDKPDEATNDNRTDGPPVFGAADYDYEKLFSRVPLPLKLAYRLPLVLIAFVLALLLTIGVPLAFGFMTSEAVAVTVGLHEPTFGLLPYLSLWVLGLFTASGFVLSLAAVYVLWAEVGKVIRRFSRFIRNRSK